MKRKGYYYTCFTIGILWLLCTLDIANSEAFSSTANLLQLVKSETNIASSLENVIKEEEQRLTEVKRYYLKIFIEL